MRRTWMLLWVLVGCGGDVFSSQNGKVEDFLKAMSAAPLCERVQIPPGEILIVCDRVPDASACIFDVLKAEKAERFLFCSAPAGAPGNYVWTDCSACIRKHHYYALNDVVKFLIINDGGMR